jgi:hypothetical protein
VPSSRGAAHVVPLSPELTEAIAALGKRLGTTPYMTVLAAFQAALAFHTGQSDIAVGTVVANRERAETEQLVGFFVNTLVLRGDFSDDPTPATLLARTRERVLEAFSHQSLPFEKVVDALSPERELSRNPLVQVLYTHTDAAPGRFELGGVPAEPYRIDLTTAKFDLTLDLRDGHGRTELAFRHADVLDVDLAGYDVVVLAALVGSTAAEKSAMLLRLSGMLDPGTLVLVRSARGMRTLLYPEVDPAEMPGFEVLDVVHPGDDIINSAIVARVRPGTGA